MKLEFRQYRPEDFEDLCEMVLGLYTKDGIRTTHMTKEKVAVSVKNLMKDGSNGRIHIFEKSGKCIGYCIINQFWSNEFSGQILYVDELFVKPKFRNSGVGSQFFEFLQANPENDSVAFMLETVSENEKAIGFYRNLGFKTHHNHMMFKQLV